jgi:hypothetical protein
MNNAELVSEMMKAEGGAAPAAFCILHSAFFISAEWRDYSLAAIFLVRSTTRLL